jgi:glycogen(starch) synthase
LHLILLTWEFPPRVVGEISRDMEKAAIELAQNNCRVDVITIHEKLAGTEKCKEKFNVHRVATPIQSHPNVVTWALAWNTEMQRVATDIIAQSEEDIKLVHASEWLCVSSAVQIKKIFGTPFTFSLYSTEAERSGGGPLGDSISYLESKGCAEAMAILVKKKQTLRDIQKSYGAPADRIILLEPRSRTLSNSLIQLANAMGPPKGSLVPAK